MRRLPRFSGVIAMCRKWSWAIIEEGSIEQSTKKEKVKGHRGGIHPDTTRVGLCVTCVFLCSFFSFLCVS